MYSDLSDFIQRTEVVIDENGDARVLVSRLNGVPLTLIGFVTSADWEDFDIKEQAYAYYRQLTKQINIIKNNNE